ncbi:MAG: MoaD/ThiS family protein [Bacteroidetes bacterium]|nr:MoaD/ThiS family protein [Bacteroidota bacterium]
MKLNLNNNEEVLDTSSDILSINEIRAIKKFSFNHLVVKINNVLIKKVRFDEPLVRDGDKVDIIHLISGG